MMDHPALQAIRLLEQAQRLLFDVDDLTGVDAIGEAAFSLTKRLDDDDPLKMAMVDAFTWGLSDEG